MLSERRGALNIVFAAVIIAVALYMLARNIIPILSVDSKGRARGRQNEPIDRTKAGINSGRTRREALGTAGRGRGHARCRTCAALAEEDEKVLTEALVLRDPEIPVAGNPDGDITIVE